MHAFASHNIPKSCYTTLFCLFLVEISQMIMEKSLKLNKILQLHGKMHDQIFIMVTNRKISIRNITQVTFTCSKSTIETSEKGEKYAQS